MPNQTAAGIAGLIGAIQDRSRQEDQMRQQQKHQQTLEQMQMLEHGLMKNEKGMLQKSPEQLEKENTEKMLKEAQLRQHGLTGQGGMLQEYQPSATQRLDKAPAETKVKLGMIVDAFRSGENYRQAFGRGERQKTINQDTPIIGGFVSSTPIDLARSKMEEAIGRLHSGGSITSHEEARFRKMIPTAFDSDEMASQKLEDFKKEMENKFKAFGFSPSDLPKMGFNTQEMGFGPQKSAKPGLLKMATPDRSVATPGLSNEDMQAIQWAKKNMNDPRAQQILKMHGGQ